MTVALTPEYIASLRKGAEHMRDHNLVLQDARGTVTLALLDRIKELEDRALPAHKRLARENFPGLAEINRQTYEAANGHATQSAAPMTHNGVPVTFMGEQVLLRRKP